MKMQELEELIRKLRYYKTDEFINDYSKYIKSLDKQSIDNILGMNYDKDISINLSNKKSFRWENVFLNNNLLKSPDFNKILDIILVDLKEAINKQSRYRNVSFGFESYYGLLNSDIAWKYGHLLHDLDCFVDSDKNLIDTWANQDCYGEEFEAKKNISNGVERLSTKEVSLIKSSHKIAMQMLRDYVGSNLVYNLVLEKANAIYDIQSSEILNDGELCRKYFEIIDKIDSIKIINYVKDIMLIGKPCDEIIYYLTDTKDEAIAEAIYETAKAILMSDDFDKYKHTYLDDLYYIANARNITITKELQKVALSLESIAKGKNKHEEHMRTIACVNNTDKAKSFAKVILNTDYDDLDAILYNAQRFVDSCGDDKELPSHVFSLRKKDDK